MQSALPTSTVSLVSRNRQAYLGKETDQCFVTQPPFNSATSPSKKKKSWLLWTRKITWFTPSVVVLAHKRLLFPKDLTLFDKPKSQTMVSVILPSIFYTACPDLGGRWSWRLSQVGYTLVWWPNQTHGRHKQPTIYCNMDFYRAL